MLNHFTHPQHPLYKIFVESEYSCDGCNTLGSGSAYACNICNFVLHELCANCPRTLTCRVHPSDHPLGLVQGALGRSCNLCNEEVKGLCYTCEHCMFVLHPLCTQLPKSVQHQVHPEHVLTLQPGNPNRNSWCAVCRCPSDIWSYSCEPCGVAVHLECAFDQGSGPPIAEHRSAPDQTRGLHHTHPYHGLGQYGYSNNMGYHYYPYNHMYPPPPPPLSPHVYYPVYPPVQDHPSGSAGNKKRRRMYKILGAIGANVAASVIGGFFLPF